MLSDFALKRLSPRAASGSFEKLDNSSQSVAWETGQLPFLSFLQSACLHVERDSVGSRERPFSTRRRGSGQKLLPSIIGSTNFCVREGEATWGRGKSRMTIPEQVHCTALQLPLQRIMGVWGGGDWEFEKRLFCSFICSTPPKEQCQPFWLISSAGIQTGETVQ